MASWQIPLPAKPRATDFAHFQASTAARIASAFS
jgi:hypothetical protein